MSVSNFKYHCSGADVLNQKSIQRQPSPPVSRSISCTRSSASDVFTHYALCAWRKLSPSCLAPVHPSTLDSCVILSGNLSSPHQDRESCPCSVCIESPTGVWGVKIMCQKKSYFEEIFIRFKAVFTFLGISVPQNSPKRTSFPLLVKCFFPSFQWCFDQCLLEQTGVHLRHHSCFGW